MNIVDYIIIVLLLLSALKGFKDGLIPTLVNLAGSFLIFIIAFYLKQPLSILLYENLPFLSFGGIFKGIVAINILFYEAIAYGLTITLLTIIFMILKKVSIGLNNILSITLFLNLPSKIIGAVIGIIEGILYCFILLFIASTINTTSKYVIESKYGSIIFKDLPIISNVTSNFTNSVNEVYNVIINNDNDTNKANLESIDILMKYNILSYDSAQKLYNSKKLNINGVEEIIEKYKGEENDKIFKK